ncbi:MAG: MEKHLA domain-containing protein [Gammaproteobacteria bacterium]
MKQANGHELNEPPNAALDSAFFRLLQSSYEHFLGSPLVPPGTGASWLYREARFAVLAANTESDPRFVYANRVAQQCFEYSWTEFTSLRACFSAEPADRAERQAFLDTVTRDGFATGYRGLRTARSGRRFWIEQATVWQLVDDAGLCQGQAALVRGWRNA